MDSAVMSVRHRDHDLMPIGQAPPASMIAALQTIETTGVVLFGRPRYGVRGEHERHRVVSSRGRRIHVYALGCRVAWGTKLQALL